MCATGTCWRCWWGRQPSSAPCPSPSLTAGWLDAVARGSFSRKEWPRILQSQLASSEALILWALYGTSILALVADAASKVYLAGHVSQADVDFVVNRILDLAAGASGLYAAK